MKAHRELFTASLLVFGALGNSACGRDISTTDESISATGEEVIALTDEVAAALAATEAPTGFDNLTNGFTTQADFEAFLDVFAEVEVIADGLGPTYNAQSCRECHQNPVVGGGSQVTEFRAGHFNGTTFVDHPGGSLLQDRAIDASIQERVAAGQEVRTLRASLPLFGDGYVEAIADSTITALAAAQPAAQRGTVIQVEVLEAGNARRVARFGWKNQHASLESFSADAYVNEMGITSPLQPTENSSNGNSVAAFDTVADPEDDGEDLEIFANFIRSLKAPPRGPITASVTRGQNLFNQIGCATCHVASITTAPTGTVVNGGTFTVPASLGDKIIHPYSDFLLHNVGTGDGIVQNGGQGTRNQVRTPPLWGLRTRDRLMHDGLSLSRSDAITRHAGQAATASNNFQNLSTNSQNDIIDFINSI